MSEIEGGEPIELIRDISYASDFLLSSDESTLVFTELKGVLRSYTQNPIDDYYSKERITGDDFNNDHSPCFNEDLSKVYFIANKNDQVEARIETIRSIILDFQELRLDTRVPRKHRTEE